MRSKDLLSSTMGTVLVTLLCLTAMAPVATAASPVAIHSAAPMKGGEFGISVSVNSTVIVGAPLEQNGTFTKAGHAYTFTTAGALKQILSSPNPQTGGEFGTQVEAGDNLTVTAPHETAGGHSEAGDAYVFGLASSKPAFTLYGANQTEGVFGASAAAYGRLVAVGAPGETHKFSGAGNVYLFNTVTGKLLHTFSSPNPQTKGAFGTWVALSGTYLIVGAVGESVGSKTDAGHAYVYSLSTYSLLLTLQSPNAQKNGKFGWDVAISGGYVLVTAPYENSTAKALLDSGNAYAFNPATGVLVYSLVSTKPAKDGYFGFSATENSTSFVIGAKGESNGGHVYVFSSSTGKLNPGSPISEKAGGSFGFSVASSGATLIVGAPLESVTVSKTTYTDAGQAYIF